MDILEKLELLENEATDFGFQWETSEQIMSQIKSELREIETHLQDGDKLKLQAEIGDALHAIFSLCVFHHFNPQKTLEKSVGKFESRFKVVKQLAHEKGLTTLNGQSFSDLMIWWNKAKEIVE